MKYEYKTYSPKLVGLVNKKIDPNEVEAELNALGEQGWELINVVATTGNMGVSWGGTTSGIIYYFKRQR